jgi:murein DD-endopeptidase MepM/ murein hydrolase activator NlpD
MDDYTLVEYRPGRWAKIEVKTGTCLGPASSPGVRAWRLDQAESSSKTLPPEDEAAQPASGDLALDRPAPLTYDAWPPSSEGKRGGAAPQKPKHQQSAPGLMGTGTGAAAGMGLAWPLPKRYQITCSFQAHRKRTPPSKMPGIDLGCPAGTEVRAWAEGKVIRSRWSTSGGRSLWIQHDRGITTYYAHLNCACVLEGETVTAGQKIGETGMTGHTTGPHLHFSVVQKEQYLDPERFLVFEEISKV